jgi:hypothetical protein
VRGGLAQLPARRGHQLGEQVVERGVAPRRPQQLADCLVKGADLTAAQESSRIVEKGRSQMNADPTNRRTDRS